jgi:hypothetical protein
MNNALPAEGEGIDACYEIIDKKLLWT